MVVTKFAFFVLVLAIIMIVSTLVQYQKKKISGSWLLFWSGLWILGAASVFFTTWLDAVGHYVIGDEGKQLVVYLAILALFYICYRLFLYVQRLNEAISKLVEELAKKK